MLIDALFPVRGDSVPLDHSHFLFKALSRVQKLFHEPESQITFAPLYGRETEDKLYLTKRSVLRVRFPEEKLKRVTLLDGKYLDVAGSILHLDKHIIRAIEPKSILSSPFVGFRKKKFWEFKSFMRKSREALALMGIRGNFRVGIFRCGPRKGQRIKRVQRIHQGVFIGYPIVVSNLAPEDSLLLQNKGLGRLRIGCGFFAPVRRKRLKGVTVPTIRISGQSDLANPQTET